MYPQVAIAVRVEGLPQQQRREREASSAAADLLAAARDLWEARVKPVHDKKESFYEGQVRCCTGDTWTSW